MNGKYTITERITPQEAVKLFEYSKVGEIHIATRLYDAYTQSHYPKEDLLCGFLTLLSFIYDTGRVQGIREERAKRGA